MVAEVQSNVPKLRFPEFEGDWEYRRLGEIAKFSKGRGISKADITLNDATPCIRYGELYTYYGARISKVLSSTNISPEELILPEGGEVIVPASVGC